MRDHIRLLVNLVIAALLVAAGARAAMVTESVRTIVVYVSQPPTEPTPSPTRSPVLATTRPTPTATIRPTPTLTSFLPTPIASSSPVATPDPTPPATPDPTVQPDPTRTPRPPRRTPRPTASATDCLQRRLDPPCPPRGRGPSKPKPPKPPKDGSVIVLVGVAGVFVLWQGRRRR